MIESSARELGLWEPESHGERIEDRGSQITFSALGQQAPLEEKLAWDADGSKRRSLRDRVAAQLPENELRRLGEEVRDDLNAIPGITQVDLQAVRDYEISVEIPESVLRRYGLPLEPRLPPVSAPKGLRLMRSGTTDNGTANDWWMKRKTSRRS